MVPFCRCCNYATVGYICIRIFNFVALTVITAPHNASTPHISKSHWPIVSLNARELEMNSCSKDQSRKKAAPPNSPRKALGFIIRSSLSP